MAWEAQKHALGVGNMDRVHMEFAAQVDELGRCGSAEFPALFRALIEHTRTHFHEEGLLMRSSKYPGLGEHEGEHHRVLGELLQLNRSLKRGRLPLVRAYARQGLPEWFDNHVATMDGALAMHLKKTG